MNKETKPFFALLLMAVVAMGGLAFLMHDGLTGAISGQQTAYGRIYDLRYNANPCSLLSCKSGPAETMGYDPATGQAICRCFQHAEPHYQISHWRKQ